jgi:hypothetical protein
MTARNKQAQEAAQVVFRCVRDYMHNYPEGNRPSWKHVHGWIVRQLGKDLSRATVFKYMKQVTDADRQDAKVRLRLLHSKPAPAQSGVQELQLQTPKGGDLPPVGRVRGVWVQRIPFRTGPRPDRLADFKEHERGTDAESRRLDVLRRRYGL